MAKKEGNAKCIIRLYELGKKRAREAGEPTRVLVRDLTVSEQNELMDAAYKLAKGCERASELLGLE